MALIYFYDASELDKRQLSDALSGTDHYWKYVDGPIELSGCDPNAEVISIFVSSSVTRACIEAMPKLKLIACRSTGFDNVDLQAAHDHGVTVVNVPTYGENTVAEYAFMMLLALVRKLPEILRLKGERFTSDKLMGHDLQGKTFGVLGTGHIGIKALQIAKGFSMETIAYDAAPRAELESQYGFTYVGLDEVLSRSDFISLHMPSLPSTRHLIDRDRLARMKQGAILINTARGELVNTSALVESLESGHLGGAALDVVEGEIFLNYKDETLLLRRQALAPESLIHSVEVSVLEKMQNVILSPHNAFNTSEAILRINQTTARNIIDFWYAKVPHKVEPLPNRMGTLLIARHTESAWNALGKWTGVTDVSLSDKGFADAARLGRALKELGIKIDAAFCSQQVRTRETLESMLSAAQLFDVRIAANPAINERDYGVYTGKNKWEVKDTIGEEAFNALRRGWDVPIENGESLKDVYTRALPFYKETVIPLLREGKNVLIVAHGNSIRALLKYIDSVKDEDVASMEIPFGEIIIYTVSSEGLRSSVTVTKIETAPTHA